VPTLIYEVVQDLDRDVLQPPAPHEEDDRHVEAALPHQADERRGLALQAFLAPVHHHAAGRAVGTDDQLGIVSVLGAHHGVTHPLDFRENLAQPRAFEGGFCRRLGRRPGL
jgi:hypothetical protein